MEEKMKVFKHIDVAHQDVYRSLEELFEGNFGGRIKFSFRKDNDGKHVFFVSSRHLLELNLSEQKITAEKPWDIYVRVARALVLR